ncbi:MAG: hypothetical protein K9N06_02865 [Candidatus Cloacimonetes bacterium]|nr:hypothetical protein [Candidatus Cloacimonadota bacterium]
MKKKIIILMITLSLAFLSLQAAPLRFEGYLEGQYGANQQADEFKWNIWDPNIYFEARFNSSPMPGTDMFFKFYSDKDNPEYQSGKSALAVLTEGHVSFRQEMSVVGMETNLFTREGGRYWLDGSMLGLLNTGSVNNDGNGQGVRMDFWMPSSSLTYVISDFSSGAGDDVHLARFRQNLFNNLRLGATYQRKNYASGGARDYNQLYSADAKYQLGSYYLNWEIAATSVPAEEDVTLKLKEYEDSSELSDFFKRNIASKMEVSGFKTGNVKLGYITVTPGAYFLGDTYRNYMGNNEKNKYGYWVNSYYLVPQRAITITCNYWGNRKMVPDTLMIMDQEKLSYDPVSNLYTELYVEFINGFKWKLSFNKKDETWQGSGYKHYDVFTELQVENRLAKLLSQFKIKDLGETSEKQIWGIECSVNLTERWRLFSRGMVANDRGGSRYSIFGELSYKIGGNAEAYIQYGPGWWGQYGLVNDDGFASGGEMKEELKLIVKGWF